MDQQIHKIEGSLQALNGLTYYYEYDLVLGVEPEESNQRYSLKFKKNRGGAILMKVTTDENINFKSWYFKDGKKIYSII